MAYGKNTKIKTRAAQEAKSQLSGAVGIDKFNFLPPTASGALRTMKNAAESVDARKTFTNYKKAQSGVDTAYGFKRNK